MNKYNLVVIRTPANQVMVHAYQEGKTVPSDSVIHQEEVSEADLKQRIYELAEEYKAGSTSIDFYLVDQYFDSKDREFYIYKYKKGPTSKEFTYSITGVVNDSNYTKEEIAKIIGARHDHGTHFEIVEGPFKNREEAEKKFSKYELHDFKNNNKMNYEDFEKYVCDQYRDIFKNDYNEDYAKKSAQKIWDSVDNKETAMDAAKTVIEKTRAEHSEPKLHDCLVDLKEKIADAPKEIKEAYNKIVTYCASKK